MASILIVDDEAKICKLLQAELIDAGHDALGLTTGREALESAEKTPPRTSSLQTCGWMRWMGSRFSRR